MARKRLSMPFGGDPDLIEAMTPAQMPPLETKAMPFGPAARAPSPARTAPISRVAGDAAAESALAEIAGEMQRARAEGRLVQELPLAAVEDGWLIRDRLALDEEELGLLMASIAEHGQRMPVEVADLGGGRYGLISGWRRLSALRRLAREGGEARPIRALIRRPEAAGDAYVAMVEENEIRAGLSYYERARIAAAAVEAGAFTSRKAALQALYAHASRARRSKIGSFLTIHDGLGSALRHPSAIPERLGLALAARLTEDADFGPRLAKALAADPPATAGQEIAVLTRSLRPARGSEAAPSAGAASAQPAAGVTAQPAAGVTAQPAAGTPAQTAAGGSEMSTAASSGAGPSGADGRELAPGLWLRQRPGGIGLEGPAVDAAFVARLERWLREG